MNIVDIGAGKYVKYSNWLSKFPNLKIYAFEPHPDNFAKLTNLKNNMNPILSKRLLLFKKAVSNKTDTLPFHLSNDRSSSSLLPFATENLRKWKYPLGKRMFKTVEVIDVQVETLADILKGLGLNTIELLNIDTQGDSVSVLETPAYNQFSGIKKIMVKAHSDIGFEIYRDQCQAYDVVRFLKRRYFQLLKSTDYSHNQEQILTFINEPMQNRKAPMFGFE